jgi:midasin
MLPWQTFEQTATNVAAMLAMARKAFTSCRTASSSSAIILEKLLIIISDGRNIFSEGEGTVREAIRSARLENIFIIFLIVENIEDNAQKTRDSILDIRHTSFDKAGMPTIVPYMEKFPFAQYVIIRNIESLPQGMSDALRQWFAMVTSNL